MSNINTDLDVQLGVMQNQIKINAFPNKKNLTMKFDSSTIVEMNNDDKNPTFKKLEDELELIDELKEKLMYKDSVSIYPCPDYIEGLEHLFEKFFLIEIIEPIKDNFDYLMGKISFHRGQILEQIKDLKNALETK